MVQIMVWIRCDSPVQLVQLWVVRGFTTSWYFILRYTLIAMVRCTAAALDLAENGTKKYLKYSGAEQGLQIYFILLFWIYRQSLPDIASLLESVRWRHLSLPCSASLQELNACLVEGTSTPSTLLFRPPALHPSILKPGTKYSPFSPAGRSLSSWSRRCPCS